MISHMLVATDGSAQSNAALEQAIDLAKSLRARVSVIAVIPPLPQFYYGAGFVADNYIEEAEKLAVDVLNKADAKLTAASVPHDTIKVVHEQPYQAIIDAANNDRCDLIVMASHGRRGISAILLGSETVKVLTHSKIPVLCRGVSG